MKKQEATSHREVKTVSDIHQIVKHYMPGLKTTARQMLEEGLARLHQSRAMTDDEKTADWGGFRPAEGPSEEMSSVDLLIESRMGGKRHGDKIRWNVEEGTFQFDPYSGDLRKVEE